ncbi:hypothetical protein ACUT7I_003598 [Vibrio cholerae]
MLTSQLLVLDVYLSDAFA